jgi:SAM-dependent methyltransferase
MSELISADASLQPLACAPGPFSTRLRTVTTRAALTAVFATSLTVSGAAQEFMAQSGAPGMTVADLGAGSGYYVLRLSPIVGSNGRIIAEDVVPEYLQGLRKRVRDLGLQNVTVTLGEPHDPKLPTGSVDVAILVHMYHEVTQPYGLLYNLIPALKPNARVGIVDGFAQTSEHGTPPSLLHCELAAVGYREVSFDRLKGSDTYLAIFAPPSVASRTRPEAIVACRAP